MTERERLIELLKNDNCPSPFICDVNCKYINSENCLAERIADYLLENGVCVLPYKIDTTIWTNEPFTDGAVRDGDTLIERQRAEIERLKSEKIVRCGDCKFYGNGDCSVQSVRNMYPNDYCSYGERRER